VRRRAPRVPEERELASVERGLASSRVQEPPVGETDAEPARGRGELGDVMVDRPAGSLADEEEAGARPPAGRREHRGA
jgi:hypothetical protein